jgi:outer membrane protein
MKNISKPNLSMCLSVLAIVFCSVMMFKSNPHPRIAYIRSNQLIYGYVGMKAAHDDFENKSKAWKSNQDTLESGLKRAVRNYLDAEKSLSKAQKAKCQEGLAKQQQDLYDYSKAINTKAKEEDDKVTQGVLNQVNSFVEEYGKAHGYEVILGTTLSGNVLYGDKAIDITDEILAALNRNYKGDDGHD